VPAAFDAVVLAGGAARRFGGADKVLLPVAGRSMLDRVVAACVQAESVVVVGPERPVRVPPGMRLGWTRETPPGSGPLAAVAAGLGAGLGAGSAAVVVLAADMPLLDADVVRSLVAQLCRHPTNDGNDGNDDVRGENDERDGDAPVDAVLLLDADGRNQPLAAAYRRSALRRVLALVGDPRDQPMRLLTRNLRFATLPADRAARDCDTPQELAEADHLARAESTPPPSPASTGDTSADDTSTSTPDAR
jgi:molybdopterin-guanine dinucleotide biosynthesis protein A